MKRNNNSDEEEEPDFYEDYEEDEGDKNKSNIPDKVPDLSMVKNINNINYNRITPDDNNNILNNIESDHNSNSDDNDNEDEPNFYDDEIIENPEDNDNDNEDEPNFYDDKIIENPEDNDNEQKEEEDNHKINKQLEEQEDDHEIIKPKEEIPKKQSIDLDNIYDINKEFNYNIDNPVFYLKENKFIIDKYPWPLSTKQVASIVKRENIPYENLRVKLVDIFEFKSFKKPFEYVDFIEVLKPKWTSNVTYSKIFLDLCKSKDKKEQNEEDKEKKEDKKENKKDINDMSLSKIPKVSQTNTFSVEEKFIFKMDEKDEVKEQNNNYYQKSFARRKNRKKKEEKE
jgi:hypothetical protein